MKIIQIIILILIISTNAVFAQKGTDSKSDFPVLKGKYLGQKIPGLKPLLFAPDIVSTKEFNDRDLTISPDGNQVFFARTKTGNSDDYDYDIMYSELQNDIWTDPQVAWFSSNYGEVEAFFTPDGKELFFNSNRPASGEGKAEQWETWVSKNDGQKWSEPKLLGSSFNRVCHTTFSHLGKMYYTREDSLALYRVSYKNGVFGEPEKLDPGINSAEVQFNCLIAPNESYLIFTSLSRNDGFGNGDLYISFRNSMNEWTEPINMGSEINSEGLDTCPGISNDGEFFFFTSNKGGNNDVYWVSIKFLDQFKPI